MIFVVARAFLRNIRTGGNGRWWCDVAWPLLRFQAWTLHKTLLNVSFIWCAALFYIIGSCHKAQITSSIVASIKFSIRHLENCDGVWGMLTPSFYLLENKRASMFEWKRQSFVSIEHRFYIPLYGFSRSFTRKKQIWFSFIRKIIFFFFSLSVASVCVCFFCLYFLAHFFCTAQRSSYSCFTTTVSFSFIPLSLFFFISLFVHKIRIHSARYYTQSWKNEKNAYSMKKPRREIRRWL